MHPEEKLALTKDHAYQNERKRSRPLSSEAVMALREDLINSCSNLEPMLRRLVGEEVERAMIKTLTEHGVLPRQITGSTARKFRLKFTTNPKSDTYTENKLEGEHGDTIHVALFDASESELVTVGPESVAALEVVLLKGDFDTPDEQDWTSDDFQNHMEKEREGKGPLLVGDLRINLRGGVGTLGQLSIMDNSSWTRSKKFRLGVRVAQDYNHVDASIREAKSQPFTVKDSRGIAYKKHDTPALDDLVWRLRNIGKDGPYHKMLIQHGIQSVKDFLVCNQVKPDLLKKVLGRMSLKQYKATVEHAKNCVLGKLYIYPVNQHPYESVIFSEKYQSVGAVANGRYIRFDMLDEVEKVRMDALIKSAYDHWRMDVIEYAAEDFPSAEKSSLAAPPQYVIGGPLVCNNAMEPTAIKDEYCASNAMVGTAAWQDWWGQHKHSSMGA